MDIGGGIQKTPKVLKKNHILYCTIVKLQSQVQNLVLGLGVDFVLPLSQQEEQKQEEDPQSKSLSLTLKTKSCFSSSNENILLEILKTLITHKIFLKEFEYSQKILRIK